MTSVLSVLCFIAVAVTGVSGQFAFDVGTWSACSYTCDNPVRSREVLCRDTGSADVVADSQCPGPKPATTQSCGLQLGVTYDFEYGAGVDLKEDALAFTVFYPDVEGDVPVIAPTSQSQGNWLYNSGMTPSRADNGDDTGPSYDHTLGFTSGGADTSGHYWHVEASAPEPEGKWRFDSLPLDVSLIDLTSGNCTVSFWMSGIGLDDNLRTVDVNYVSCADDSVNLIRQIDARDPAQPSGDSNPNGDNYGRTDDGTPMWHEEVITIPETATGKIRISWAARVSAGRPRADWSIDDITFSSECGPPSPTPSATPSGSASPSVTPSQTSSESVSPSVTPSPSATPSTTPSGTPSATPSRSPSPTTSPSPSGSSSQTPSPSLTASGSGSMTPSQTASLSGTFSQTATKSGTQSATATHSTSSTHTPTPTHTPSQTPTASATPTPSVTPSATPSVTVTPSMTATATATPSASPSDPTALLGLVAGGDDGFLGGGFWLALFILAMLLLCCLCCCLLWLLLLACKKKDDEEEEEDEEAGLAGVVTSPTHDSAALGTITEEVVLSPPPTGGERSGQSSSPTIAVDLSDDPMLGDSSGADKNLLSAAAVGAGVGAGAGAGAGAGTGTGDSAGAGAGAGAGADGNGDDGDGSGAGGVGAGGAGAGGDDGLSGLAAAGGAGTGDSDPDDDNADDQGDGDVDPNAGAFPGDGQGDGQGDGNGGATTPPLPPSGSASADPDQVVQAAGPVAAANDFGSVPVGTRRRGRRSPASPPPPRRSPRRPTPTSPPPEDYPRHRAAGSTTPSRETTRALIRQLKGSPVRGLPAEDVGIPPPGLGSPDSGNDGLVAPPPVPGRRKPRRSRSRSRSRSRGGRRGSRSPSPHVRDISEWDGEVDPNDISSRPAWNPSTTLSSMGQPSPSRRSPSPSLSSSRRRRGGSPSPASSVLDETPPYPHAWHVSHRGRRSMMDDSPPPPPSSFSPPKHGGYLPKMAANGSAVERVLRKVPEQHRGTPRSRSRSRSRSRPRSTAGSAAGEEDDSLRYV